MNRYKKNNKNVKIPFFYGKKAIDHIEICGAFY
jgi:hypothetical protein